MSSITRRPFRLALAAALALSMSCGPKKPAVEAPEGIPAGPVPMWSAVGPKSTLAVHVKPQPFFEIPLVGIGLDLLLRNVEEKSALAYDDIVKAFGFDPIYDMSEALVTNTDLPLTRHLVFLLRYEKDLELVEPVVKLFSGILKGQQATALQRTEILGRKAALVGDGTDALVAVQVDPATVAIIKGTEAEATAWLKQMSKPNDNRKRILAIVERLSKDSHLGGREHALAVYTDYGAMASLWDIDDKMRAQKLLWASLLAAVETDVFIAGDAEYADEAAADKQLAELRGMCDSPSGPMAFFRDMMKEMCASLDVKRKGKHLEGGMTVPAALLDTIYVTLKLMIDIGEKGGGGMSLPKW
jgi:hypothetical protein